MEVEQRQLLLVLLRPGKPLLAQAGRQRRERQTDLPQPGKQVVTGQRKERKRKEQRKRRRGKFGQALARVRLRRSQRRRSRKARSRRRRKQQHRLPVKRTSSKRAKVRIGSKVLDQRSKRRKEAKKLRSKGKAKQRQDQRPVSLQPFFRTAESCKERNRMVYPSEPSRKQP